MRMYCTAFLVYVLLATSQFNELLAQSVEERSVTNPLFYRVYNRHFSLETDKNEGLVGSDFIFFVSFKDTLFRNERFFRVEIYYMDSIYRPSYQCYISEHNLIKGQSRKYKNVYVFMFNLHQDGDYILKVSPTDGHYSNIYPVAPDGITIKTWENLDIKVFAPEGVPRCNLVGTFTFRSLSMRRFPLHASFSWAEWTTIQRSNHTCNGWRYGLPTWSVEMILHDICLDSDNYCLNPYRVKSVNISEYTPNILNVAMPVPSREESFVIMPYTFPPGIFRLCNTEMIYTTPIRHCAHMRITPIKQHCFHFMEPMRITMTPKLDEFIWPLGDLNITVHDYFCLFATLDKEYTGEIKYSYKWLCSGDILCKLLMENTTQSNMTYNKTDVIDLGIEDTTITIPKEYMTAGTTVTISFYLEYAHPLYTYFVCHGMENRTITFVNELHSWLDWRCHHNCWYYVNPELALLVGFECHDCVITTANNPTIEWSVIGLIKTTHDRRESEKFTLYGPSNERMVECLVYRVNSFFTKQLSMRRESYHGKDTPYLEMSDFGNLTKAFYTKFFIRVKVSYTLLSGLREEITMGKLFLLARNIQSNVISINSDFLFETEVSTANRGDKLGKYFPQYSLDMENMYYYVGWAAPIPVIATISATYDADDIEHVHKPASAGMDGQCVYMCTDYYHVPLKDGNYSHCNDCTKYITCTNGYLHEWNCSQDMEVANESICRTDSSMCSLMKANTSNSKHYLKDYVITRTLWAPQSFVLELFETEYEGKTKTIQLELSSYAGLRKFRLLLDVFFVPRTVPPPMSLDDVELLWAVPHKTHEVIFIDKSYLIVIARAIELTQIKRNPKYRPKVPKAGASRLSAENLTYTNETMEPLDDNLIVNNFADGGNDTGDVDIGTIYNDPAESAKLLQLVETIIDALLSQDTYQLTYSNVDLFMASLARILNIYDYNIPIMEKALRYIHIVHDFHVNNLTEPASDDEIISHKLDTLCSLCNYFVRYRNQEPLLFQLDYPDVYETALLETLYMIVKDISERQGLRTPNLKSIVHKNFVAKGAWLDVFNSERYLHIHMGITDLTIDVHGLLKSPAFDYVLYTFVNIAAYTSRASPLRPLDNGLPPNGPLMHLHVAMKHPLSLPLFVFEHGIYDIRYAIDFESVKGSTGLVSFGIYSKNSTVVPELTSDCYFIRVDASNAFASTVTIKPKGNVTFGVRVKLSEKIKDGLKAIHEDEILLPHNQPGKSKACHGIASNQYSIFLPPLTLRQKFEFKTQAEYYIMIRVIANSKYKAHDVSTDDLVSVRDEIVSINCVRSTCMQLDQTNLITKYCRVTHCTGGIPAHVVCRCDRGDTFTANTTSCIAREFDVDMEKELQIELVDYHKFNYMLPIFIVGLWCIFMALFFKAAKSDEREKMMGKTHALQGVFCPHSGNQYLMCFVTGFGVGCGTKSIPYMTIVGSTNIVSPRYKLETSDYVFVNGSEIWLLVSVPETIGIPKLIILSIETEGRRLSSWFVKEVYVREVGSFKELRFVYNTWLPSRDGLMFAVDDAIPNEDVIKRTFGSILLRLMRNQHPVFSVGYNIPGSMFTKIQHVIFCMYSVHILMLACLLAQDLPTPKLIQDKEINDTFTLKVEFFIRGIESALISLLPIYLLGVLVETATPIEPHKIEWRQEMKPPNERRLLKHTFDKSPMPSEDLIQKLLKETKSPRTSIKSITPFSLSARSSRDIRQSTTVVIASAGASKKNSETDSNANSSTDDTRSDLKAYNKRQNSMRWMYLCFPIPIYVCLTLMWAIIGSVSYYIFMLGFFFTVAGSLEFVYVFCVAFIVLVAILYPFWLTMIALVNTVLFLTGKPSYGARSESEYRLKWIEPALPAAQSMAQLNAVRTRTRSLGELDNPYLSPASLKRSQNWCRRLIMNKTYAKRKYVTYNNWETLLFIVVILLVINGQVGSVWQSFYQTEFVARTLNIQKISEDLDKALTYDEMWDHLLGMINTITSWKSNSSTVSLTILSAVKIRQIRARPYTGDCEKDFKRLIFPRCHFTVEKSVIETRTFANRWAYPIPTNSSRPGPFSYEKPAFFGDISTEIHTYPDGGYTTLFSWWSEEPVMLNYLKKNNWLDMHTKAVIVSMNFINVDSGLATIIEHIYEFRLTGIFMYTHNLYTFPLKTTQVHEFALSCLVMFFGLMTVYFLITEIRACYQMRMVEYFKETQSWFLLFERVLSIAVFIIFFWLKSDKQSKLRQVHEAYLTERDGTEFIDFHIVSATTFLLILISCMLVIVCLAKVLLRFRDYKLLANFVNLIPALAKITYVPLVFIIGFGLLGCLLFQSKLGDYKSIYTACVSVTMLLLSSAPIPTIVEAAPIPGELYCFLLYCIMFFIILNYFISLIDDAYSELKHEGQQDEDGGGERG